MDPSMFDDLWKVHLFILVVIVIATILATLGLQWLVSWLFHHIAFV